MADPFIGLPIIAGTIVTAAVVKRLNSRHGQTAAREAARRQEEIWRQQARTQAAMTTATYNRVLASTIAAEALQSRRSSQPNDPRALRMLRELDAEVSRENAALERSAREGTTLPASRGSLESRLRHISRTYR